MLGVGKELVNMNQPTVHCLVAALLGTYYGFRVDYHAAYANALWVMDYLILSSRVKVTARKKLGKCLELFKTFK